VGGYKSTSKEKLGIQNRLKKCTAAAKNLAVGGYKQFFWE